MSKLTGRSGKWMIVSVLLLSMLLSACSGGGKGSGTNDAGNGGNAGNAGNTSQQASETQNTANTGETAEPAASELEPVELSWYYLAWSDPTDIAAVNEKVNEITKREINATVKLNPLTWDNFIQKTNIMAAAGEEYDLVFTSNWINPFDQGISKGAFRELDDLWQYMPKVRESIPEEIWTATAVNGHNYGVINKQIFANQYGIGLYEPFIKEYNVDLSTINHYEELVPIYERIIKDHPEVKLKPNGFDAIGFAPNYWGDFEAIGDTKVPGWLTGDFKVVNQYETPELRKVAAQNADWAKKGYFDNRMKLPGQDFTEDEKANKFPVVMVELIKPDLVKNGSIAKDGKTKIYYHQLTKPKIFSNSLTATLTAISATSKNPERAAMLIELVNTNKELYNLLCFGIEGKHYNKVEDNVIKKIPDSGYDPSTDWLFGNQFNAYYIDPGQVGTWEATEKLNNEAEYAKLLGFNFNAEPVKTEIAAVNTVLEEYGNTFAGWFPEKYDEFLSKLKTAGVDKIIAEKQKQVDEWRSKK